MTVEQLSRLLENAQNIIMALEHLADEELQKDIEAFFQEILHSDDIDDEIRMHYSGE